MATRFRDKVMRQQYDCAVLVYEAKHRDFFYPDGSRCMGSTLAEMFWKGYDGIWATSDGKPNPIQWDAASKRTLAYAYWCAGRDIKKSEG